jgi:hypothetical protein
MKQISAIDRLTALSAQLNGMSELFRILLENDQPVRSELFEFLSFSAEQLGTECCSIAKEIGSKEES